MLSAGTGCIDQLKKGARLKKNIMYCIAQAFLLKQNQHLISYDLPFWPRWMSFKYLKQGNFCDARKDTNHYACWKAILRLRPLALKFVQCSKYRPKYRYYGRYCIFEYKVLRYKQLHIVQYFGKKNGAISWPSRYCGCNIRYKIAAEITQNQLSLMVKEILDLNPITHLTWGTNPLIKVIIEN